MMFRNIVDLISETPEGNDIGNVLDTKTYNQVFADKQSIRQSEFYQAATNGLKPELMFIIRSIDYNNEEKLRYNNKEYNIIRMYDKNGEMVELICTGIVGTEVR